tara:strand:- start:144 stop:272 length:129 start_codon:yes stop_codon:yes gene_type:complete
VLFLGLEKQAFGMGLYSKKSYIPFINNALAAWGGKYNYLYVT